MNWHIHIQGQVQGVGFRPLVYALAQRHALTGWVNNSTDGVHLEIEASATASSVFLQDLLRQAPRLSRVTKATIVQVPDRAYSSFEIIHSAPGPAVNLMLAPDFALCDECRADLYDPHSRRQGYAFTSCTNCGPRYSIIKRLPYDRPLTTMEAFLLCQSCESEYHNPIDRRYYAQTNSCQDCRIDLQLYNNSGNVLPLSQSEIIAKVVQLWEEGNIVAIKGIGGYLLTCDAQNENSIQLLRARKQRPTKPFALLFPDLETAQQQLKLHKKEAEALTSATAPIVLASVKDKSHLAIDDIAPGLDRLGLMLPYTPLYELLLRKFGRPVIATSGNISNAPIIFKDTPSRQELHHIADYILDNKRAIAVPQDDSVVLYSAWHHQRIILRRSRGWAPTYIQANLQWSAPETIAMGAMLKSTFSILHRGNTYISQYLGDLEHFDTQENYHHCFQHLVKLLQAQPQQILIDAHPNYPSTHMGQQWSEEWSIPTRQIQHHQAHFGAILGEHNLVHSTRPILGIIWDGTGLGEDGQIWGGEFFRYQDYHFHRCGHFSYFPSLAGDKIAREARLSALAIGWSSPAICTALRPRFNDEEWRIYERILDRKPSLQSSSVGRLFDAVAALVLGINQQSYEGEAAVALQVLAERYFQGTQHRHTAHYLEDWPINETIPTASILTAIQRDIEAGLAPEHIAAKFHFSLVMCIQAVAKKQAISRLAFSGGVFQNALLVDLILEHLSDDYELFFHEQLSPNDENISFGQLVCAEIEQQHTLFTEKSLQHVLSNSRQD